MSLFKVPICPQWNTHNCCAPTPDGGFLYVGLKTINYISMVKNKSSPKFKVFHIRQPANSLDTDPDWSGTKYFAVLANDNSVQIWDFRQNRAVFGHKAHFSISRTEGNGQKKEKVFLSYMCNRNVLSMDSTGNIVTYCVASNTYVRRPSMIPSKHHLTTLKCSPFDESIFAVGTMRGLVIIANLKSNQIVYTLRGHEGLITSLSWSMIIHEENPSTISADRAVFASAPALDSDKVENSSNPAGGDDIFDIYDYDYLQNEFGAPCDTDSKENCENFIGIEKTQEENSRFDFVEACQNLKEEIKTLKTNEFMDNANDDENPIDRMDDQVTLQDCQQVKNVKSSSSSCGSTKASVEHIDKSSSDDDANREKIILHEAEVYAEDTPTAPTVNLHLEKDIPPSSISKSTLNRDILLASGGVDDCIWIWNANNGSACDQIKLRHGNNYVKNARVYAYWCGGKNIIVSDRCGDIKSWSLISTSHTEEAPNKIYKFKADTRVYPHHLVTAFSLCPISKSLWVITAHREIFCEDIIEEKIIAKYGCASNTTFAIKECPDDMNKIALGFADRRLGIIDISNISPTNVNIENFTYKIDAAIHSLSWSPNNRFLAYGTYEGRVGILNIEKGKHPFLFNQFCGKPIYSLDWNGKYLYVCANEKVALYEANMINKDAFVIEDISGASCISARGNFLFVGTQRGHLDIYKRKDDSAKHYKLMQEFQIAPRYITEIDWSLVNPTYFAVSSNSNKISIFEFNEKEGIAHTVRQIIIKNPKAANAHIKWSNHNKNMFLTCGYDGAVRVWDLNSPKDDEKFLKQYNCPMFCGLFLPTEENIIMCTGLSTSVETFDMRKEASECYSVSKIMQRVPTNTLDHVQWATKLIVTAEAGAKNIKKNDKREDKKINDNNVSITAAGTIPTTMTELTLSTEFASTANFNNDSEMVGTAVASMLNEMKLNENRKQENNQNLKSQDPASIYMKNPSTLLYLTTKDINKDALEKITFLLKHFNRNNYRFMDNAMHCVKLFGKKADVLKLLDEEQRNQQASEAKSIANIIMPQIRSDLKDEIMKCIQAKKLNEWHVSLAPSISYNFWKKCSQAFGEQLLEQGHVIQAATYFLGTHRVIETVNLLMEKNYFKEALLIAKVYCQPDDPIINVIINKWISYQEFTGNLTSAALLCVLSGQPYKGYEVLSKVRTNLPEFEKVLDLLKSQA